MCELVSFNASKDINNLRDEMNQRLELIQHQLDSLLKGGAPQKWRDRVDPTSASYVINASLGK